MIATSESVNWGLTDDADEHNRDRDGDAAAPAFDNTGAYRCLAERPRRPPRFPALAQFASAARRVPRAPIPVAFALAVLAVLATVAPEPAAAQTVTTFISNTGQTSTTASSLVQATEFTTGTGTYTLTLTLSSVGIFIPFSVLVGTPAVKIYGDTGGTPGTLLATMTSPGANPIRDAAGNGAIGLSNEPVANETPETALPNMWLNPTKSDPVASVRSEATYTVTFQGAWNTTVTAGGVPSGGHFTTLIGGVHNAEVTFLKEGGMATAGVEIMAELGGTGTLTNEVRAAEPNALSVLQGSAGNIGPTGSSTINMVTLTTDHPRVTLLSMVAPSPDWFVGVSGLSLLDAGADWLPSQTVNLYPWDAGTEEGTEFSLTNSATSPQEIITSLRGDRQVLERADRDPDLHPPVGQHRALLYRRHPLRGR